MLAAYAAHNNVQMPTRPANNRVKWKLSAANGYGINGNQRQRQPFFQLNVGDITISVTSNEKYYFKLDDMPVRANVKRYHSRQDK